MTVSMIVAVADFLVTITVCKQNTAALIDALYCILKITTYLLKIIQLTKYICSN